MCEEELQYIDYVWQKTNLKSTYGTTDEECVEGKDE